MKISKKSFGVLSGGEEALLYTLKAGDLCLSATDFGGTLVSLFVPSRKGLSEDVLLGYSTLSGYASNGPYLGVTVGRFANRIAGGRFDLGGSSYVLCRNDGDNSLHGGRRGFDKRVWKSEAYRDKDGVYLRLELESPDGEEGYPGNLKATVVYGLTLRGELTCDYKAKVDAPCPVNLTNHAYFNLRGEGKGDILGHKLTLHAASYVAADGALIPTGQLTDVEGGPFDFRKGKDIGRDIAATEGGYDHCFVLDGKAGELRPCAEVFEVSSGRSMTVSTTQPGVQFYSGNFLSGVQGKIGSVYGKQTGFCLETQHYPDSPNHPEFPSSIFGPERKYHEKAVFAFDW